MKHKLETCFQDLHFIIFTIEFFASKNRKTIKMFQFAPLFFFLNQFFETRSLKFFLGIVDVKN